MKGRRITKAPAASTNASSATAQATGHAEKTDRLGQRNHLILADGTIFEVDEAWEDAQGVWYKRSGVTHFLNRERVKKIESKPIAEQATAPSEASVAKVSEVKATNNDQIVQTIWIHLVGGARVEVDDVTETATGVWYRRDTLSIFLDRARIERIERAQPALEVASAGRAWRERGWTTGNAQIDELIRYNGARYNVDPYLIFCVMEQESQFHPRAVSPVGARGLMQLMPGTAARFGVTKVFDPAQNIMGGTRYLKWLLQEFDGRVDLVLAGYNAGEGAVMKYGQKVPPYNETRNYVKRISARYERAETSATKAPSKTAPARPLP